MLDEAQLKAVRLMDGAHMILAGPGSGKTTVITERVRFLTGEGGIEPGRILVVTFTKAAAAEMRSRFLHLVGAEHTAVTFGTFHAVFFQILKAAYHLNASSILPEEVRFTIVRDLVRSLRLDYEDENEFVSGILQDIGTVKNSDVPLEHFYSPSCSAQVFRRLYRGYEEEKEKRRLLDFEDMLTETRRLLTERADILKGWRDKFQYILIDEFQDINRIQYEIIRLLAAPRNNLFIVGDDDQSIYRFRGSRPEIMLHFPEDYPGCDRVLLSTNYRCSESIVEASSRLIARNRSRFEKALRSGRSGGEPVRYLTFPDQRKEGEAVTEELRRFLSEGRFQKKEIALLFRTNSGERRMAEALMEANIPFRMRDSLPNLYEHWLSRDIFAYFSLAEGSRKREDLLRIMNRPKRYLSRDLLTEDAFDFDALSEELSDKPWVAERIDDLRRDLRMLSRLNPYAGINYIRKGIGYDEFCLEYADYRGIRPAELYETLDELQEAARGFPSMEAFRQHIEDYGKELERQSRERSKAADAVTLSTLHSSKGLEYDCVYLIDVNEGNMPYHKAVLPEDLEEERRMFYVGMTRARKLLTLCSVRETGGKGTVPSSYIEECRKALQSS